MWNIKKIVKKGDYDYALVPDHPNATKNGYVLVHRVVMENHLGRLLKREEVVHHINRNKHDNRIENLEVLSNSSEHAKRHGAEVGHMMLRLKCPWCKKEFTIHKNNSFLVKKNVMNCNCCSRSCQAHLSREKQLGRLTHELEVAISENLLAEYKEYCTDEDNSEETKTMDSVETIRNPPEIGEDIVQPTTSDKDGYGNIE